MSDDPLAQYRRLKKRKQVSDKHTVFEQETEAGSLVDGKRHRGSGASRWSKSDASGERYQVECKQTGAESFRVTQEVLDKITREATACGKSPVLHVRFLKSDEDWVVIPAHVFKRLRDSHDG